MFSDSGTLVLMAFECQWTPWALHVIHHQLDAGPVTTRYIPLLDLDRYHPVKHLTPSGEYMIATEEVDRTSHRFVSRKLSRNDHFEGDSDSTHQDQDDSPVYLDDVVCLSSRLADSNRFLLLGENDDEKMRLLIVPREGRALEIKPLSFSFNEAKRRLEIEWEKRRALKEKEKEKEETGRQSPAVGGE